MSKDTPHIWLPTTTTKVTVVDGVVTTWDEMEMEQRPITKKTGFAKPSEPPEDPSFTSP